MTPLQAKLFYWMECIKCKRTQLKLRVVYWWTHKTQAEATQAIKESRDWAHSLSKEQVQEMYQILQNGGDMSELYAAAERIRQKYRHGAKR